MDKNGNKLSEKLPQVPSIIPIYTPTVHNNYNDNKQKPKKEKKKLIYRTRKSKCTCYDETIESCLNCCGMCVIACLRIEEHD